jgi:hypothetical protein
MLCDASVEVAGAPRVERSVGTFEEVGPCHLEMVPGAPAPSLGPGRSLWIVVSTSLDHRWVGGVVSTSLDHRWVGGVVSTSLDHREPRPPRTSTTENSDHRDCPTSGVSVSAG